MVTLSQAQLRHASYYEHVLSVADDMYVQGGESSKRGLEFFENELASIRTGQSRAQSLAAFDNAWAELCRDYSLHGANLLNLRFPPQEQINWGEAALVAVRSLK